MLGSSCGRRQRYFSVSLRGRTCRPPTVRRPVRQDRRWRRSYADAAKRGAAAKDPDAKGTPKGVDGADGQGAAKRAHLWENSRTLHAGLKALGFTLGTESPQSAIISVIMPDLERGAGMWEALLHEGLYVNLARPPATPAGMTLLRCSLCAEHSASQVQTIIGMFERAGRAVGII